MPKNAEKLSWSCICGRIYKYESGYYRHRKTCPIYQNIEPKIEKESDELDYKSLFLNMIHENKELRSQITDLIPKVGSNNNIVNNKQRFNINIFLNVRSGALKSGFQHSALIYLRTGSAKLTGQ